MTKYYIFPVKETCELLLEYPKIGGEDIKYFVKKAITTPRWLLRIIRCLWVREMGDSEGKKLVSVGQGRLGKGLMARWNVLHLVSWYMLVPSKGWLWPLWPLI